MAVALLLGRVYDAGRVEVTFEFQCNGDKSYRQFHLADIPVIAWVVWSRNFLNKAIEKKRLRVVAKAYRKRLQTSLPTAARRTERLCLSHLDLMLAGRCPEFRRG